MSIKLAAFPKCYIEQIAGERSMSVFEWIDMARALDCDGLEMYDGFFTSLEPAYIDRIASPTRSRYAGSRLVKNPSYISRPSASSDRAISIQSRTDMVRSPAIRSM